MPSCKAPVDLEPYEFVTKKKKNIYVYFFELLPNWNSVKII